MNSSIFAFIIAFAICAVLCPIAIPVLHRLKFGQQVRNDGPQEHLKKQGTPTMGGIMFLIAIIVTSLIFAVKYPNVLPVLLLTAGFGLVGFLDDFLKVVKKQSEGLNPKQKLLLQLVISIVFSIFIMKSAGTATLIPFAGIYLDLKFLYIPFCLVVILGTDNGVNFTDGVDGLCSSVTFVTALFFLAASVKYGGGIEPICAAVAGSLLGFLLFNAHPAKVFMGDTGSLALGGFVAGAALSLRIPVIIIIVGFIYLIEVVSVMIQVVYFKKTHGKRFFRMAPIHHHFELGGWSETQVVTVFSAVTILLCLVAYMGL